MKCKYCEFSLYNEKTREWRENVMYWHQDGHERELNKAFKIEAVPRPPPQYQQVPVPPPRLVETPAPPPPIMPPPDVREEQRRILVAKMKELSMQYDQLEAAR